MTCVIKNKLFCDSILSARVFRCGCDDLTLIEGLFLNFTPVGQKSVFLWFGQGCVSCRLVTHSPDCYTSHKTVWPSFCKICAKIISSTTPDTPDGTIPESIGFISHVQRIKSHLKMSGERRPRLAELYDYIESGTIRFLLPVESGSSSSTLPVGTKGDPRHVSAACGKTRGALDFN